MKTTKTFFILLFCLTISNISKAATAKSATIQLSYNITPPGTVEISDLLYYDRAEVSNSNWVEYLYWIANKFGSNSTEYQAALPDTTVWGENMTPYTNLYLRHPSYQNYPIVGISYEQAVAYCQWRSNRVNEAIYLKKNKIAYDANSSYSDIPNYFTYRLPTELEWTKVASAGYSKRTMRKYCSAGNFKQNLKNATSTINTTSPTLSYLKNKLGIYNLFGNVAEMTIEKGKAKGGSWNDFEKESAIHKIQAYTSANKWVGFRCICDKKSRKY